MTSPKPVGIFGTVAGQARFAEDRDSITSLVGGLAPDISTAASAYLSSGAIVLALMEQTTDVIGSVFKVLGGSAILTDGVYYWRRDTASYVERYQVALPDDFVEHMRALNWTCPEVRVERITQIDRYLVEHARR